MKATPIPEESRTKVQLRARFHCERCGAPTMNGHWHHRRSRSVRDELVHSPANGVWLCPTDHAWVHAHPFEARAEGFIVSRHSDPRTEPIQHWALGRTWLREDGSLASEGGTGGVDPIVPPDHPTQ